MRQYNDFGIRTEHVAKFSGKATGNISATWGLQQYYTWQRNEERNAIVIKNFIWAKWIFEGEISFSTDDKLSSNQHYESGILRTPVEAVV